VSTVSESAGSPGTAILRVGGQAVAEYVFTPKLEWTLSPRPYLHPVRTPAGTVVTDLLPADHLWHLGASLAVPDVAGANLWGGRSYVHGQGYVWLDDHGAIEHLAFEQAEDGVLVERLRWRGPDGATLLEEHRTIRAEAADGGWVLRFAFELRNPNRSPVELRSPAASGRGEGAGYGGFFWRLPPIEAAAIHAGPLDREEAVNGSAQPTVTVSGLVDGAPVSLTFSGLDASDRWFVRLAEYPGVGAALAFDRALALPPGAALRRGYQVLVSDGGSSEP
jgi:hypothetical protein